MPTSYDFDTTPPVAIDISGDFVFTDEPAGSRPYPLPLVFKWEDYGVTGNPASAWKTRDENTVLRQSDSDKRPAVVAFGETSGLGFDGGNDYLASGSKLVTETGAGSLAIVFKTGATVAAGVLVAQSDTASANNWFEVGIASDGRLYVESNAS